MARYKISSTGCQVLIFNLLVFDQIHISDAIYLNKMSWMSSIKYIKSINNADFFTAIFDHIYQGGK